ncbi:MAG: hypothetical protein JXA69_20820 [Phycisphaerae bacterium]|nr:hypothetical protein [Phycisphaerae bacterium]
MRLASVATIVAGALIGGPAAGRAGDEVTFKARALAEIVRAVPGMLKAQDPETGRFGEGIWIVTEQNVLFPLAVAWATKDPTNPYYHSDELLGAIMAGGDALIDDQDASGQWEFRKKDGSTWGKIYMPWTYSRWIRAYALIRDAMPAERRERWVKALRLGFDGIARTSLNHMQNIPAHHAMCLYIAGQVFDEPAWTQQAADFLGKVVAAQDKAGYWSEHMGPVVNYNMVYVDALGTYYAVSGDKSVLPALRRAAVFHLHFTYPNGALVETVDERNPYYARTVLPNVGFSFSPEGRTFVARQLAALGESAALSADGMASFLLYGEEGPGVPAKDLDADGDFVLGDRDAVIRRRGPWFIVVSAMRCPISGSRWIQDRQNFVSVYHKKAGLILGGGNTKLQPGWSTFTVGDPRGSSLREGDTNPNFNPPAGLLHVPTKAVLITDGDVGVDFEYGEQRCAVGVKILDDDRIEYRVSAAEPGAAPVAAHVTLLPKMGEAVASASGKGLTLGDEAWAWPAGVAGEWMEHAGVRFDLPPAASVRWPVLPHNPYTRDGHAAPGEGRIVIDLPLTAEAAEQCVRIIVR